MPSRACPRCARPWRPRHPQDRVCPDCARDRTPSPSTRHRHQLARHRRDLLPRAIGQPCPLCGETMRDDEALDVDHVVPAAEGGQAEPSNLRVVHASCNRRRGTLHALEIT